MTHEALDMKGRSAMFVTDLDGTLLDSEAQLSGKNRHALERLGRAGVLRVAATGRSLALYRKVADESFPVDYVIFSTGAGIADAHTGEIVRARALTGNEIADAEIVLHREGLDFMVHLPVPGNHEFVFHRKTFGNRDFESRIARSLEHGRPMASTESRMTEGSQLLAIVPPGGDFGAVERVRQALPHLSVVRASSPIDHQSVWIEIFPKGVTKSDAAQWLFEHAGIGGPTCAVGNDWNDLDLLHWAGAGYLVENAPREIWNGFRMVPANNESGVAHCIDDWLESLAGRKDREGV